MSSGPESAVSAADATSSAAQEAWQRLRAISSNSETVADEHRLMHAIGLGGGPVRALRHLPLDGSIPMRQLAAAMQCDNSYVTGLIDALEEHGLATRGPHPTDRRIKVITLTEAGRSAAAEVQRQYASPPSVFEALSAAELEHLCELLRKLDGAGA